MKKHPSLADLTSVRATRSKGPPPPTEKLQTTRRRKPTPPSKSTPAYTQTIVSNSHNTLFPQEHCSRENPPQSTPPPPIRIEPTVNMSEEERINKEINDRIELRMSGQLEEIAKSKTDLEALQQSIRQEREQLQQDKKDLEQAYNTKTQHHANMADIATALGAHKRNSHIREPSKFSKPTRGKTTHRWLKDYERYIRVRYPGEDHPKHISIAKYLDGTAFEWYSTQPHSTQDSYTKIAEGLLEHFKDRENDFKMETLEPFDSTLSTMEEWLKKAQNFFRETDTDIEAAIIQVATVLNKDFKEAIRIEGPTTWTALSKTLRMAYLNKKHQQQQVQKVRAVAHEDETQLAARLQRQEENLSKITDLLMQQQTQLEEQATIAAMGGARPKQPYTKPHTHPTPPTSHQELPSMPPNYRGRREDFDPDFTNKLKRARQLGYIPEGCRFKGKGADLDNLLRVGSLPPHHFVPFTPRYQQQPWQQQPQQQQPWQQQSPQQQWQQQTAPQQRLPQTRMAATTTTTTTYHATKPTTQQTMPDFQTMFNNYMKTMGTPQAAPRQPMGN